MNKVKKYIISICVMLVVAFLVLLALSMLVYLLKWQADKAAIGIIVAYILAGISGGRTLKVMSLWMERREEKINQKIVQSFLLATGFVLVLGLISFFVGDGGIAISKRFWIIWMLLTGSVSIARVV